MVLESPRGVRDFGPKEMAVRDFVSGRLRRVFESFGYRRVQTPTFEFLELFSLKSGQDIREHLYVLEDKGGRKLCLRPEATASVARMFASQMRSLPKPLRVYYDCQMFRYEEPQKGRYREFWQAGVELMGAEGPFADAEVICMAHECLKRLGLRFALRISHIGVIRDLLSSQGFDEDLQNEVIRSIDKGDIKAVEERVKDESFIRLLGLKGGAEAVGAALKLVKSESSRSQLEGLGMTLALLDGASVDYTVDFSMARGLDYYTGFVFDAKVEGLGAQNQVLGGGRYDRLVELFGGPRTPAVGFAFGLDRLIDSMRGQGAGLPDLGTDVYVIPVTEDVRRDAFQLAVRIRRECEAAIVDLELSDRRLNRALQHAIDVGARYAVLVGAQELRDDSVVLKCLKEQTQEKVRICDLKGRIR